MRSAFTRIVSREILRLTVEYHKSKQVRQRGFWLVSFGDEQRLLSSFDTASFGNSHGRLRDREVTIRYFEVGVYF
jgi:hypothetical protein